MFRFTYAGMAGVIMAAHSVLAAGQPGRAFTPPADLPQAIASFGAAIEGQWLYVLGGHIGEQHHHSTANLSHLFMRQNLIDRTTWELLPGGVGLQSVSLVAYRGQLYRVGGMRALNAPGEAENLHSVDEVARFDPLARSWTPLPPLPEPRSSHDAVVYDGRLYVAGGWTLSGAPADATWINRAYVMDLRARELHWDALPEQPFRRRAVALAVTPGRLYVLGGIAPDGKPSQQVDVLDLDAKTWSRGPDLPGNGFGISATVAGDRVYASGLDGKLYRLDAAEQSWEEISSLGFPRIFHRLLAAGQAELLVVGGANKGGHVRVNESIALIDNRSRPEIRTWTLPWPGEARNRQAVFLHHTSLLLFGGNNSLEQHDFEPENFVRQGLAFNLGSLAASPAPAFPAPRQSMVTAVLEAASGPVGYALGGFGHDGQAARSFDDVYRYDFRKSEWSSVPVKLPAPLTQFGLVSHGSELWLLGGLDYDPRRERDDRFRHSDRIYVWDTLDESAGFKPLDRTLLQPRRAFGCAAIGERVYVVGGMRENFKPVEECEVLDMGTRTIGTIPAPRAPRISPELVALDGRLYLVGGSSPNAEGDIVPNESIEVYDPATRRWSVMLESLPIPAKHIRAMAFHGRLLLASTHDENGVLRIALLRPGMDVPAPVSRR